MLLTKDKIAQKEISDADLDQVTGGLLGHELTHVVQDGVSAFIGETEKNLSSPLKPKSSPDHLRETNKTG